MTDAPDEGTKHRLTLGEPFADVTLAYREWGPADAARTVVAVHGLTRNAADFAGLATALAGRGARVLAVDVVGRGDSSWLADPSGYAVPTYAGHLARWLERLELDRVDWVGTSMGGLIGMALAASERPPLARLVLNDVGPFVPKAALAEIGAYLAKTLRFASLAEVEAHLRTIHAGFGPLTDAQWRRLARTSVVPDGDGWRLNYDPAIRVPYADLAAADIDLWELYDRITVPTLVLNGTASPLLDRATCEAMRRRGPRADIHHVEGVGHAPALLADDQIDAVATWLGL
ncbi:MAG: alpha/beta fold hydrolase [Alphaproteobacteria bacterium]